MPAIPKHPQVEPEPERASVNDWAGTPTGRAAFWANVDALGQTKEEAYGALGCSSIYEFPDDLGTAFRLLADFAAAKAEAEAALETGEDEAQEGTDSDDQRDLARRYAEACRGLPESPVLVWTQFQLGPGRPTHTISMRPQLEPELMDYGVSRALTMASRFDRRLRELGGFPIYRAGDTPGLPSHDKKSSAPAKKPPATAAYPSPGPAAPPPLRDASAPPSPQPQSPEMQYVAFDAIRVVAPQGKAVIQLWAAGRKYAEIDYRLGGERFLDLPGAEKLAELGFEPDHFNAPGIGAEYAMTDYGLTSCQAGWVPSPKNLKWKDLEALVLA